MGSSAAVISDRSGMAPRMRRGPRHRHNQSGDSVEHRLSIRYGRAPKTWRWDIYAEQGCFGRARKVLEELLTAGDRDHARMLLGQLTCLFLPVDLSVGEAQHRQDVADATEDLVRAHVIRTPDWIKNATPEELEDWERKLREQVEASTALADVIRRERDARKEARR